MSGMYTTLPLTQVLRAGEQKQNPGKRSDRDGLGAATGDAGRGQRAAGTFAATETNLKDRNVLWWQLMGIMVKPKAAAL